MSESLYRALAATTSGYVIAPAGCGKTEAIVQAVKNYCSGKQLILTHTHAGVGALRKRFKVNQVPSRKYHIETISGWALSWVRNYPSLSGYEGALPIPQNNEWSIVYTSAQRLLSNPFVQWVIMNSYNGVIVDEYQDCTLSMHNLMVALKAILSCRVLGDPMQGIFEFGESLVEWAEVETEFEKIGELQTPYRWINANNQLLGNWLIQSRADFMAGRHPSYENSPIIREYVDPSNKASRLQRLTQQLNGSICIIGPKHGNLNASLGSSLVNVGFFWVEANDLPSLGEFLIILFDENNTQSQKSEAAIRFITRSFVSLGSHKNFVEGILRGTLRRRPNDQRRKILYTNHNNGYSHRLLLDLIYYIFSENIKCKKRESVTYLVRILEQYFETQEGIIEIFAKEIAYRKVAGSIRSGRCIGTTLLLKGLEFDHVIILYNANDNAWSNLKDFYVALTRGCHSVRIICNHQDTTI